MTNHPSFSALARLTLAAVLAAGAALSAGCGKTGRGPYSPDGEAARDPRRADELNAQAADLISRDPERAEILLREALTFDLFHGPAHNNLGVVLLAKGRLYDAAAEFEWAKKLMPASPDPRINLALVLDKAGRCEDAIAAARAAVDLSEEHLPALQTLARLQIGCDRTDASTIAALDKIAFMTPEESWRDWAIQQRLRLEARPTP
jgi:tetratricopeptide (TPR) repeat protein